MYTSSTPLGLRHFDSTKSSDHRLVLLLEMHVFSIFQFPGEVCPATPLPPLVNKACEMGPPDLKNFILNKNPHKQNISLMYIYVAVQVTEHNFTHGLYIPVICQGVLSMCNCAVYSFGRKPQDPSFLALQNCPGRSDVTGQ